MKAYGACQVHDAGHTVGAAAGNADSDRHRAARYVLGSARDATPGPWESARQFSQPNVVYAKNRLVDSVGVAGRRLDLDDRVFTGQTASRSRSEYEADARWIAAMSPAAAPMIEGSRLPAGRLDPQGLHGALGADLPCPR
jgi:hypothetical protein